MATAAKTSKPFEGLRCPHCGEVDSLNIKVESLELECRECSEEVTRADVQTALDGLARLLRWIDTASEFAAPK